MRLQQQVGALHLEQQAVPFEQETATSYEAGFKTMLFDRKLRLNGAYYHTDYNNYQGFFFTQVTGYVRNIDGEQAPPRAPSATPAASPAPAPALAPAAEAVSSSPAPQETGAPRRQA